MLTPEDIKSIVASGEGYNAEFKIRVPAKVKELSAEICAFANAAGGVVLIGVDDSNNIKGVHIDNDKRSAIQNSLNEINPHLHCSLYNVDVDGKDVWVVEVSSGLKKPYTLSGAIYVRQGSNTQKITSVEQMRDYFQQSGRIYFDEGPCAEFNIAEDIDALFFEEFRIAAGLSKAASKEQIINNLKLTYSADIFKNGGVLFFGSSPELIFEKAVTRCVAFDGINKTQIIDDKIFGGPLMRQYQHAMQWLKSKLNVRYEIEGSGPRKEIWEIPETVFKESIINSLSHRDYYDKGARTTIEFFSDRVEITNPGGLVSAISPEEFGTKSHSRNPLIFGLFERIDMVEQIGSGINRIKDEIAKANLPFPQFKTNGMFTVVFQRRPDVSLEEENENTREKTSENTREKTKENTKEENNDITREETGEVINKEEDKVEEKNSTKENNVETMEKTREKNSENTREKTNENTREKTKENTREKTKENTREENKDITKEETREVVNKEEDKVEEKNSTKENNAETREKTREKTKGKTKMKTGARTRVNIMKLIKLKKSITTTELAQLTGISEKGIEYHLSNLKNENLIKRIGSDKGGYWEILI